MTILVKLRRLMKKYTEQHSIIANPSHFLRDVNDDLFEKIEADNRLLLWEIYRFTLVNFDIKKNFRDKPFIKPQFVVNRDRCEFIGKVGAYDFYISPIAGELLLEKVIYGEVSPSE